MENSKGSGNFAKNKNNGVNDENTTQMEFGSSNSILAKNKQIADKFRTGTEAAAREFTENNAGSKLTFAQKQDIEKQVAYALAYEDGMWVSDIYILGKPFANGNENTVLLNEQDGVVYKSNNLMNAFGNISTLFDTVEAHNKIFPETAYEIYGFTGFKNKNRAPYIEVILKQPFVRNVEHATQEDIAGFMAYRGFRQINHHTFENDDYVVFDLRPRNVLKSSDGVLFVVDNRIEVKQQKTQCLLELRQR